MEARRIVAGRERPVSLEGTPVDVARRLRARRGLVWFDSSAEQAGASSLLACEPAAVLRGNMFEPADRGRLRAALATLPKGSEADHGLPAAGLAGAVDYDGAFCFGVYNQWLVYQHDSGQWWDTGDASRLVTAAPEIAVPVLPSGPPPDFRPQWTRDGFITAVRHALDYIAAGDIYQVNLAQSWSSPWPEDADAFGFYERLRAFSPVPHGAFLDLGGRRIMSASPELFLRLSGNLVKTRPIKGTRPRRRDTQEDERSAYELLTSPKEIAELVMITDLERNDLGQVCDYGSVTVTDLLRLERFQQVFHLVSTVEGRLRPEVNHLDALAACFPGGSITGAPKKRAREIIAELEPAPRGLFTGAIGYLGTNGESQFSIAIRTAVAEHGRLHFHAGAGIVAESSPEREYEETLHKAAALFGAAAWHDVSRVEGA